MVDHVGNVQMNLTYYDGNDYYSDGSIEEKLLEIVKDSKKEDYNQIILESASWPVFYHLSEQRENIINWYPIDQNADVLEVGAGCGAISGCLADRAKSVTAIELSYQRSLINAYRNREYENLKIVVGNFENIAAHLEKKYDYITLIGVFEYAANFIGSTSPYEDFLNNMNELLTENGKIILAIENRMGLKYFAGCIEDHLGMFFKGIQGYTAEEKVRTFSKSELEKLLKKIGYERYKFYYPYPDYKFPTAIYSDEFLPKKGTLHQNINNFDADRLVLFNEDEAFDNIIGAEMFPQFSNSFLLVIERKRH